jgi:hypothetical protein
MYLFTALYDDISRTTFTSEKSNPIAKSFLKVIPPPDDGLVVPARNFPQGKSRETAHANERRNPMRITLDVTPQELAALLALTQEKREDDNEPCTCGENEGCSRKDCKGGERNALNPAF